MKSWIYCKYFNYSLLWIIEILYEFHASAYKFHIIKYFIIFRVKSFEYYYTHDISDQSYVSLIAMLNSEIRIMHKNNMSYFSKYWLNWLF